MDPGVTAALITAGSIIVVAFLAFLTAKVSRVHNEIKTNHGKRAGEYLEENAVASQVLVDGLVAMGAEFADALAAHTAQDTENFELLRTMLQDQNERVGEVATLHRLERKFDEQRAK